MTPEQEANLFTDVGTIKANLENYHNDTKKALNLITGNGRPEDGILYIMADLNRTHRNCPVMTGELPDRVTALENAAKVKAAGAEAVAEAQKDTITVKTGWIKALVPYLKHPAAIVSYFLTAGGATVVWNWKSIVKGIAKMIMDAYSNGG